MRAQFSTHRRWRRIAGVWKSCGTSSTTHVGPTTLVESSRLPARSKPCANNSPGRHADGRPPRTRSGREPPSRRASRTPFNASQLSTRCWAGTWPRRSGADTSACTGPIPRSQCIGTRKSEPSGQTCQVTLGLLINRHAVPALEAPSSYATPRRRSRPKTSWVALLAGQQPSRRLLHAVRVEAVEPEELRIRRHLGREHVADADAREAPGAQLREHLGHRTAEAPDD